MLETEVVVEVVLVFALLALVVDLVVGQAVAHLALDAFSVEIVGVEAVFANLTDQVSILLFLLPIDETMF